MYRIILVDDQNSFLEALKYTLEQSGEIQVAACASHGREAYELCQTHRPDLVLMDLVMPVCDGIEGTDLIKSYDPGIKVLVLTTFSDDEAITKALQRGADGYLMKEIETKEIVTAIRSVMSGFGVFQNNVLERMTKLLEPPTRREEAQILEGNILNTKEIEIIHCIVDGMSNQEIAEKLFYTEGTVKNIITGILAKLHVKDRTQLAVFAVRNRWV